MKTTAQARETPILKSLCLIWAGLFMVSALGATPFRGTISGHVTGLVDDWRSPGVTLPEYGINSPLFVGDAITGFYSYDSPTRDVQGWGDGIDLNITFVFAGHALDLSWACYHFSIVASVPSFWIGDDTWYDSITLALSASESRFSLEEIHTTLADGERVRQVWGSVICSPSSAVKIPESGGTMLLIFISAVVFCLFGSLPQLNLDMTKPNRQMAAR